MFSCLTLSERFGRVCGALILTLLPLPALAHAPSPGMEGFWRGTLHALTDPVQMQALLAIGLWVGLQSLSVMRVALTTFLGAAIIGVGLGLATQWPQTHLGILESTALGMAALTAALVALGRPPFPFLLYGLAAGAAFLTAILNTPEPGATGAIAMTTLGSLVAIHAVVLFLSGGIDYARETYGWPTLPIAVRVLAAWILAISALMLALPPAS